MNNLLSKNFKPFAPERRPGEFKIGDLVRVIARADPDTTCWARNMDPSVGVVARVIGDDSEDRIAKLDWDYGWWYPVETLELVEACDE